MLWADEAGRSRRPIVAIDDHLYHTNELLNALASVAPEVLPHITVCALDRSGPDTDAAVAEWRERFPDVLTVTLAGLASDSLGAFARDVARLVRPGGLVLQDVQLETLPFIPADRWWESIYVGATIRGLFAQRPPLVRFCSNKRGYDATFGRDLLDAGFDPRDVMDKTQMIGVVAPALVRLFRAQFPRMLRAGTAEAMEQVPAHDADRADVEKAADVVLWQSPTGATLGGRALAAPVSLKAGAPEIVTWQQLIDDRLAAGEGVPVIDVGSRLAERGAERAEQTNVAARHLHGLRARLHDSDAIVTAQHRYRIADGLSVAIV